MKKQETQTPDQKTAYKEKLMSEHGEFISTNYATDKDAPKFFDWLNDYDTNERLCFRQISNRSNIEQYRENYTQSYGAWAWYYLNNDRYEIAPTPDQRDMFTGGDWIASEVMNFSDTLVAFIRSSNGKEIAQLRGCTNGEEKEAEANAALIADAPRLYKENRRLYHLASSEMRDKDKLKQALSDAIGLIEAYPEQYRGDTEDKEEVARLKAILNRIK